MKKIIFIALAVFCLQTVVKAQENEFKKGWQFGVKAGVNADWVNRDADLLFNPAAALDLGYKFTPRFTLRGELAGWRSTGAAVLTGEKYRFKTAQASINAVFNFFTKKDHFFKPYLFIGPALSFSFANEAACELAGRHWDFDYPVAWHNNKYEFSIRGGIGTAVTLSPTTDLIAEIAATSYSEDHDSQYNIAGKYKIDGGFSGMLGLRFNLCAKPAPIINTTTPAPVIQGYTDEDLARVRAEAERAAAEKYAAERAAAERAANEARAKARQSETVTLFFINKDKFLPDEQAKLSEVVYLMKQYPEATVTVTGYADKETGNPSYNMNLSSKRAEKVKEILAKAGISESRITTIAKGDTEAISDVPAENRAVVCITR